MIMICVRKQTQFLTVSEVKTQVAQAHYESPEQHYPT